MSSVWYPSSTAPADIACMLLFMHIRRSIVTTLAQRYLEDGVFRTLPRLSSWRARLAVCLSSFWSTPWRKLEVDVMSCVVCGRDSDSTGWGSRLVFSRSEVRGRSIASCTRAHGGSGFRFQRAEVAQTHSRVCWLLIAAWSPECACSLELGTWNAWWRRQDECNDLWRVKRDWCKRLIMK